MKTVHASLAMRILIDELSVGEFHASRRRDQSDFVFCGCGYQAHGRLALAVRSSPCSMVLLNLLDMVGNVAQLTVEPSLESHYAFFGMLRRMRPNRFGNVTEDLMGHLAKTRDQTERFPRTLVKIAERAGPQGSVVDQSGRTRLGNELAAADVRFGLTIGQMQNDFVDAPTVRGRTI